MAGEHALLIGTGGIGTFAAFVASRSGARVTVVERSRERAESALSLGAHSAVIVDDDTSTSEAVAAGVTEPIDVVYEMSGSAGGIEAALANVREGGRVVAVGFHGKAREIDLFRLTLKELDIIGTNSLSLYPDLHVALQLVASRAEGWADVAPTVLGLDQLIDEGLVPLSEGRATRIKTLVDPAASLSRASVTASGQG
jgi:(R,R)-butanediol dehydrogenase/meso-butanediol dehydrogenase/diacetyl reductase